MDRPGHERAHQLDTLRGMHEIVTEGKAARRFEDVPTFVTESFEEDLELELDLLKRAGIEEVVVVDLIRAELEISVVKAVIPGLEPPHRIAGYVPGPRARGVA